MNWLSETEDRNGEKLWRKFVFVDHFWSEYWSGFVIFFYFEADVWRELSHLTLSRSWFTISSRIAWSQRTQTFNRSPFSCYGDFIWTILFIYIHYLSGADGYSIICFYCYQWVLSHSGAFHINLTAFYDSNIYFTHFLCGDPFFLFLYLKPTND